MTTPAPPQPAALDQQDGLERLMGDRALYLQILRRFRHDQRDTAGAVRQARAAGDLALARRKVHTLKGAAGMIGARAAYLLALELELELACASAAPDGTRLARLENALEQALAAVIGEIDLLTAPQDAPAPPEVNHAPAAGMLLQRLAHLLEQGDGAAIDVLEQSAGMLAASLGMERYRQVAAAAHQFDFATALQALQG